MTIIQICAALLFATAIPVSTEATGDWMGMKAGMSVSEAEKIAGRLVASDDDPAWKSTRPREGGDVWMFRLGFTRDSARLCKVQLYSNPTTRDGDGHKIEDAYALTLKALTGRLGQPTTTIDKLEPTGPGKPIGWMAAILQGERELSSVWILDGNSDNVSAVALRVVSVDDISGVLVKDVHYTNASNCPE